MRSSSFKSERVQNRLAGLANFGLRLRMNFEHAELPLDDLHAGHHAIAFQRDIGHAIDFDAGRNFDIQAAMPCVGKKPCAIVAMNDANCGCMLSRKQ